MMANQVQLVAGKTAERVKREVSRVITAPSRSSNGITGLQTGPTVQDSIDTRGAFLLGPLKNSQPALYASIHSVFVQ